MRILCFLFILSISSSGLMATSDDELQSHGSSSSSSDSTRAHVLSLPLSDAEDVTTKFRKSSGTEPGGFTANFIKGSYPGINWTPELISQFIRLMDEVSAYPELNGKPYKLRVNKAGDLEINYFN